MTDNEYAGWAALLGLLGSILLMGSSAIMVIWGLLQPEAVGRIWCLSCWGGFLSGMLWALWQRLKEEGNVEL